MNRNTLALGLLASAAMVGTGFHMAEADDLGLDALLGGDDVLGGGAPVPAQAETASGADTVGEANEAQPATTAEAAKTRAPRVEVAIADLEFEQFDLIPAQKRFGGGNNAGSKYDFDSLAAPVAKADGSGFSYSAFTVKPADAANFDAERLKRSVQSAAAGANREAKDQNLPNRFLTRSVIVDGQYVGHRVFRVDATQDTDTEDSAAK